jgi:tetratricopeptide (TPR) repeat protein
METKGVLWLDTRNRRARWNSHDLHLKPSRWFEVLLQLAQRYPDELTADDIADMDGFRGEIDRKHTGKITARYIRTSLNPQCDCALVTSRHGKSEGVFALNPEVLEQIQWSPPRDHTANQEVDSTPRTELALHEVSSLTRGQALIEAGRGQEVQPALVQLMQTGSALAAARAALLIANLELSRGQLHLASETLSRAKELPVFSTHEGLEHLFQLTLAKLEFADGRVDDAKTLVRRLLGVVKKDDHLLRAKLALFSGVLQLGNGQEPRSTERFFHQALEHCLHAQWWWGVQACYANLGLMCVKQADYHDTASTLLRLGWFEKARDWFTQALEYCRDTGFHHTSVELLVWTARAKRELGEIDQIGGLLEQAFVLSKALASQRAQAEVLLEMGEVAWRLERVNEARRHWNEALGLELSVAERASLRKRLSSRLEDT